MTDRPLTVLPEGALLCVLSHLQEDDLRSASHTCRRLWSLASSDALWEGIYTRKFGGVAAARDSGFFAARKRRTANKYSRARNRAQAAAADQEAPPTGHAFVRHHALAGTPGVDPVERPYLLPPWERELSLRDRVKFRTVVESRWRRKDFTIDTVVDPGAKFRCMAVNVVDVPEGAFGGDLERWRPEREHLGDAAAPTDGDAGGVGDAGKVRPGESVTFIVAGDEYCALRVYRCTSRSTEPAVEMGTLRGHRSAVTAVVMRFPHIWSSSADGCVRVWDMSPEQVRHRRCLESIADGLVEPGDIADAKGLSDSLASLKRLRMLNGAHKALDPRCTKIVLAHTGPITAMDVFGDAVLTGGSDGTVKLWPVDLGPGNVTSSQGSGPRVVLTPSPGSDVGVSTVTLSRDYICVGCDDGSMHVWERANLTKLALLRCHDRIVFRVRLGARDPDTGETPLLSCSQDGSLCITSLPSGRLTAKNEEAHTGDYGCIDADWCGPRIVSVGHSSLRVWGRPDSLAVSEKPNLSIKAHYGCVVRSLILAPDGVFTCAFDKRIVFWDFSLKRGEMRKEWDVYDE